MKKLISAVRIKKNKFLILNSRATIFGDVLQRESDLKTTLNGLIEKEQIISMEDLSLYDKAKILYQHLLIKSSITNKHYELIKQNENYLKIVKHNNYNPRIIEYITTKKIIEKTNYDNYIDFVFESLNNPNDIWKIEYNKHLSDSDKLLLTSIYSLTNTTIPQEICFDIFAEQFKIRNYKGDPKNAFNTSIERLSDSMIKLRIEGNPKKCNIGIANPSINDFLRENIMYPEAQETHKYIRHMKYRNQIDRLYKDNSEKILIEKTIDESINSLIYDDNDKKIREIAEIIINNKIKSGTYKNIILDYINLLTSHNTWYFNEKYDTIIECMQHNQDLSNFYDLYSIPQEKFKTIISRVSIEEFYKIAENSYLTSIFNFNEIITESFLNCVDSQDYNSKYQNYINDLIADSYYIIESYSEGYAIPNEEEVERINEEICNKILADIKDDIKLHFSNLSILEKLNDDLDSICFDFSDSICETVKTIPDPDYIEKDENQDETDKIRIIFSKDNIK